MSSAEMDNIEESLPNREQVKHEEEDEPQEESDPEGAAANRTNNDDDDNGIVDSERLRSHSDLLLKCVSDFAEIVRTSSAKGPKYTQLLKVMKLHTNLHEKVTELHKQELQRERQLAVANSTSSSVEHVVCVNPTQTPPLRNQQGQHSHPDPNLEGPGRRRPRTSF